MATQAEIDKRMNDLMAKLRRRLGNVTTTQLTLDQAKDAVVSAIREYSKYKPIRVLDYLTTEIGKSGYDLSAKSGIIKVKEVYYNTGITYFSSEFPLDFWALSGYGIEGISIFENPSIWTQFMQKVEKFKELFDGDFEYEPSTKLLTLIPPPSSGGGKVYYVWHKRHDATTVPEDDEDTLLLWARAEGKESMYENEPSPIQSVSGYGESVTLSMAGRDELEDADGLKEKFKNKLSPKSLIQVG